jgi:hypothetical protein
VTYRLLERWIADVDRQPGEGADLAPAAMVKPSREPASPAAGA